MGNKSFFFFPADAAQDKHGSVRLDINAIKQ